MRSRTPSRRRVFLWQDRPDATTAARRVSPPPCRCRSTSTRAVFATAEEAAAAVENDSISWLVVAGGAHLTRCPSEAALKKQGATTMIIIGAWCAAGLRVRYKGRRRERSPPGTVIADAAEELIHKLNARLGHSEAAE